MDDKRIPFLCIITPIFDPAFDSLGKLVAELQAQTCGDFFQVMISNGPSPKIAGLVAELNRQDRRFIYDEMPEERISSPVDLLVNLGKRRDYCLKKYQADRFVFLDADIKIIDQDYFLKLYAAHREIQRDVLITLIKIYNDGREIVLPAFPIQYAHIDIANYTFSGSLAKKFSYPTDYDSQTGMGNDYRFFSRIANEKNTAILNFVSAIRDGNNSYKRLTELFLEKRKNRVRTIIHGIWQKTKTHLGLW
jgi:hypothetical protein